MNYMDITLENRLSSQIDQTELINAGSIERVLQNRQSSVITYKKSRSRLYRTHIILSATLLALSQIWGLNK